VLESAPAWNWWWTARAPGQLSLPVPALQEPRKGPEGGGGDVGLDVGEKTSLAGCGEDAGVIPCPWPRAGHAETEAETDGSPE